MKPHVLTPVLRPGVTDIGTVGQFEAITDHTRMLADGRHSCYAIQYSLPIGPGLPKPEPSERYTPSDDRPTAARYYRILASTALSRMRTEGETRAEAIEMAAALTDTTGYPGIDATAELSADEISVIRAILLAIA